MTQDLLERHDDDLDRRLRAAMTEIAAGYHPATVGVIPARRRRRPRWPAAAAAAAVAVIGVAGVWALHDRRTRPAATETTEVVPPSPPWLAGLTLPDVERPQWAVALDPSLGVDELPLNSPYLNWVHSQEPLASRWFVRADGDAATATLTVFDQPARAWDRRSSAEPYELDGVEAHRSAEGHISWRTPGGVRTVTSAGLDESFVEAFVDHAVGVDDLDDLAAPDGFTEIHQVPMATWQIGGDWRAGLFWPRSDERDLMLSTWALRDDGAVPIPDGWLIGGDGEDGWLAVVSVGEAIAMVDAPSSVDEATMRDIASLVSIVPADSLPVTSLSALSDGTLVTDTDLLAGGELEWGRWLALDVSDAQTAPGSRCLQFLGAFDVEGCSDATSPDLTLCRRLVSNPLYVEEPGRWVVVTTRAIDPGADLTVSVAGEPADFTIERSGGMTFVHGATGGAVHSISVALPDGAELCPR